ncbi:MAG: DUF1491 family protein [Pseudomonadota bacterium]|nr:DUF1491 family protein [Pseudomonadota bacterium]
MELDRLKSSIWIQAQIRICSISNLSAYVVKRGDPDAGAIFLHLNKHNDDNRIYYQTRTMSGQIAWSEAGDISSFNDQEAYEYLEKQKQNDPDLWILEIEDPEEKYKFDGIIIK